MENYTRREIEALTPELLGKYHDLLMAGDPAGFEELMEANDIAMGLREELRREFMLYAARILRRKWRGQKLP